MTIPPPTPHPTTTRCPSRADRSPPASAPLRARLGPAPPAHGGAIHGHARRSGCVCSAARASRRSLRVAPGSVQPAAPSALRGGRTRRLRRLSLTALRIHSLRSGHGLPKGLRAQAGRSLAAARTPLRRVGCCEGPTRLRVVVGCGTRSSPVLRAHEGASEAQPASSARAAVTRPLDPEPPPGTS